MCLLVVLYQAFDETPILVAANREEHYGRPSQSPRLRPGPPRVICGIDEEAGGTWLGVNEHGVLVAITNRPDPSPPAAPRSRGLLCRDLLSCGSATDAATRAEAELVSGQYAGANFICLDRADGWYVGRGHELVRRRLDRGLTVLTNGDPDDGDDRRIAATTGTPAIADPTDPGAFLEAAEGLCRRLAVKGGERGTVSSDLITLATPGASRHLHAPGPLDSTAYEDRSASLAGLLAGT